MSAYRRSCRLLVGAYAALFLSWAAAAHAEPRDLGDTIDGHPQLKTLARAIAAAGLQARFKAKGSLTLFAPTDEAFGKLPKAELDKLLANKARLRSVLLYHAIMGRIT